MVPLNCSYREKNITSLTPVLRTVAVVHWLLMLVLYLCGGQFIVAVPEVGGKLCLGEWPAIDTNPLSHLQQMRRTVRTLEREGGRERTKGYEWERMNVNEVHGYQS